MEPNTVMGSLQPYAGARMNLTKVMLTEWSETQKRTAWVLLYHKKSKRGKTNVLGPRQAKGYPWVEWGIKAPPPGVLTAIYTMS